MSKEKKENVSEEKETESIESKPVEEVEVPKIELKDMGTKLPGMKWYVVHTYSGFESKAKQALIERVKKLKLENHFCDVLVPTESVVDLVKGQKRVLQKKYFPGYILVKMILNDNTWHVVKQTPKITGFVGNSTKPSSVTEAEIARITNQMIEGEIKPKHKIQFSEGESVRVVDGPFSNFNGVVENVRPDKGKVRVLVSILGRATPVELDFIQVEKN